jgi:hypothetical protein
MVSGQMVVICGLDLIYKVVNAYYDYLGHESDDWYDGLTTDDFRKHTIDRWGFNIYNQTDHLKQNYAQWAVNVQDEQRYALFLLRY